MSVSRFLHGFEIAFQENEEMNEVVHRHEGKRA